MRGGRKLGPRVEFGRHVGGGGADADGLAAHREGVVKLGALVEEGGAGDGGMVHESIKNSKFPYPFGAVGSVTREEFDPKKAPPGPWRPMWTHLTHACKEGFYNCFEKNKRIEVDNVILVSEE